MTSICGWLNVPGQEPHTADSGVAMTEALARESDWPAESIASPSAMMIITGGLVPSYRHRADGLLVSLIGHVRWDSESLERLARDTDPAAAAAQAYREQGPDCVLRMRGPFSIAIFDGASHKGLLAIDRMGIQGLCYSRVSGGIVFATSAGVVAAHPAVRRRLNPQAIYNYLYCENVPGPGTIYHGISKLLPGQRLLLDGAGAREEFYWRLDYRPSGEPEAALRAEFRHLLRESVSRAATEDAVGAFLSGGTDSSTVAGTLGEVRGRPADTYSIGFEAEGFDEIEFARIATRHFGCSAHEYYVTPRDVADSIPLIAAAYDEPFGNASAVPTYHCARLAKQDGKTLLLAGDGGDEIFGGNARYAKQKVFEWYWALPGTVRKNLLEPALLSGVWMDRIPPLRKARSYVQQARIPMPDRLETYNFLEREALAEIFEPEFLAMIDPDQPKGMASEIYDATNSPALVNRMMHLDLKKTLADNDLRKVNRMCELAGIEVRYPLLDDDMVAFSGRLPPSAKVRGLRLRHFFKEALRDFLPPETLSKSKHGFGLPFGLWMQRDDALRELAQDNLRSFRQRGYLRPAYIDRLLAHHASGHASYYGVMIWILLMLESWLCAHDQ